MACKSVSSWVVLLSVFNSCYAAVLYTNSSSVATTTSKSKSSSTITSTPSTITPLASLPDGGQSTTEWFPITPGSPYWGNQSIPINTCTEWNLNGIIPQVVWTPCHIFAGTVQLSYFPPASGNVTYPSTYYNEAIGITMTSPSMYMVINTISVYNDCGQVGPTMKDLVISLDPTDVSTIALYTATDQHVNTTPPTMLTLTDIINGCSTLSMTAASTNGAIINDHAMANEYNKCFPALAIPSLAIETLGLPYYRHCGADNARFGLYDPPGAVPPVNGLLPTSTAKASATSTAVAAQTPSTNQPANTAIAKPEPTTSTAAQDPVKSSIANVVPESSSTPGVKQPASSVNNVQDPTTASDPAQPATSVNSVQAPTTIGNSAQPATSVVNVVQPATSVANIAQPSSAEAIAPVPIATVGSEVISAVPGASTVVVGGQTASLQGEPITISSSIIQLTPSGLAIVNADGSSSSIYTLLTSAKAVASAAINPQPIATLPNAQLISASAGASTLLVGSQILTLGGQAITLAGSNSVATFAADGLVIEGSSGEKTTYALPASSAPSQTIATIGNQIIAAPSPGASSLVIGSQTLALNGPAITLAGSNSVATFAADGLVIEGSSGEETTYALPVSSSSGPSQPIATIGSQIIAAPSSGASSLVIGSQILALNGPAVTLVGSNAVATLGAEGLVVAYPGGAVSTYSAAAAQAQKQTQTQSSGSSMITAVAVAGSSGEEVVVQGKTLTKGGEVATLSDGQVVSLASGTAGVVVMGKGGEVTTVEVVLSSLTVLMSSTGSMKGVIAVQTTSTSTDAGSSSSGMATPELFLGAAGESKDLGFRTLMLVFAMGGMVGMLI